MRIRIINFFYKFILSSIICILIYCITNFNELIKNKQLNLNKECNPINYNKPYKIMIDGEIYPKRDLLTLNKSINFECLNKNKILKKILLWNKFVGDDTFLVGLTGPIKPFKKHSCPVTNCELINDRNRVNESDYVIVHIGELPIEKIPIFRPKNQQWIFFLHESPAHVYGDYTYLNNKFNLTYTYKLNSDFMSIYYSLFSNMEWAYNENFDLDYNYLNDKIEFATALISNCNDKSNRLNYINELKKYVSVNVYGTCGKKCPTLKNCREIIAKRHMFYLSFENSICN
jgi:alpha-1,3-fucosyltransferase